MNVIHAVFFLAISRGEHQVFGGGGGGGGGKKSVHHVPTPK